MKTSNLLKRAERFLWNGVGAMNDQTSTLCGALEMASRCRDPDAWQACSQAQARIMYDLCGHVIYPSWAVSQKLLPADWYDCRSVWYPTIQSNRLNWLRELQKQFKEKGD